MTTNLLKIWGQNIPTFIDRSSNSVPTILEHHFHKIPQFITRFLVNISGWAGITTTVDTIHFLRDLGVPVSFVATRGDKVMQHNREYSVSQLLNNLNSILQQHSNTTIIIT